MRDRVLTFVSHQKEVSRSESHLLSLFPSHALIAAYEFEDIWIITSISLCWDRLSSLADESFARGIWKSLQIFVDILDIMLFSSRWNPSPSKTEAFLLHEASQINFMQEGSLPMMSALLPWRQMAVSISSKEKLIIQLCPTWYTVLYGELHTVPD